MFGKKIPMFAIFVLGLALVSAALVPYLSGLVTGSFSVNHPLSLKISGDNNNWQDSVELGNVYGGQDVKFYLQAINHLTNPLSTNLNVTVSTDKANAACNDFSGVTITGLTNGNIARTYHTGPLLGTECSVTSGVVTLIIPAYYLVGETETYTVNVTFGLGIVPAKYTISIVGMV